MEPVLTDVIVNGRKHSVNTIRLSYADALSLAGHNGVRTVTWSIPKKNRAGSMVAGDSVWVCDGMVVNVANTSGA